MKLPKFLTGTFLNANIVYDLVIKDLKKVKGILK